MKRKCPKCNSDKVIPILYGYPSGDMLKKAEMGEIKLGGCKLLLKIQNGFVKIVGMNGNSYDRFIILIRSLKWRL